MKVHNILNKMDADELRNIAEHQEDAIRAYQEMVFRKDQVIEALETLYRHRIDMEEARIRYDVKMANLRYLDDRLAEKYDEPPVCTCEVERR